MSKHKQNARERKTFMGTEIMWVDLDTEKLLIYIVCDLGIVVLFIGRPYPCVKHVA